MGFNGHSKHDKLVITANFERSHESTINESSNDFNLETTSGRMYESCIGSGCSRSPSPIRREFWESNKPLPEIVLKRKELALRNRGQVGEEGDQKWIVREGSAEGVRQGRPRFRINQSRDPLFVYNDASENGNGFGASQIPRDHTPSPRRPRTSLEVANRGNLTLDVDVTGDDEGYRDRNVNYSSTNSPRSVKFVVNSSQENDNDCGSLCCPSARSRSRSYSPSSQNSPCQFVDRGSSPVSVRSRSPNPGVGRSNGQRVEVHNEERTVEVDEDDDGNLHIHISASGENSPASPMYTPCPSPCCRKRSRSPTPTGLSVSPTSACRTPSFRGGSNQNSIEISSDDGDVEVAWEGSGVSLEVDLENSDDCSTPRRVNVRCNCSTPPKSRSTSTSRSPRSRSPRLRSPKSVSPTAPRSPDPNPGHSKPLSLESRPAWDNTSLPTGRGALRLDRPPPIIYKSRSPSKSRSRSATPKSRTQSPYSRTPSPRSPTSRTTRKIEIHHRLDEESPRPAVEVDYEYVSESIDSQSTSSCSPQRSVCCTPFRSRCSTPCRSRCSSTSKSRPTSSGSRSRSPHGVEIRRATSDVPLITIHRDYLSSSEGSARSKSEPPSCTSPRSSPRVTVRRSKSRSATPPKSKAITSCVSNSTCRAASPCLPCEPVSSCCNCSSSCSCCPGNSVMSCCHASPSSPCKCSHQILRCHIPCSTNPSISSCCLSCRPPSNSCMRVCHSSCPEPEPFCASFCPAPGDIIIRARQRQPCPHSGKDDGQVGFFCHRSACGLREGDTLVRLGRFDRTGKWCASDVVGMYMLGSQGLWIFLGEEEGHECLRPVQADHHQIVRTVNRWFRPRLGDLIIHTLPGPHSFYFWNPRKRLDCDDTRLLLRAYIGIPQYVDEHHNLSCCATSHLPVGYAELYVNVRNQWLFLGRDDHMFTECEITSSS